MYQKKFCTKFMTPTEAAYIAGIMDGEGSISLWREKRKGNKSGVRFKSTFTIANTNLNILNKCIEYIGCGKNHVSRQGKDGHKTCYHTYFTPYEIRHIIPQITGYLVGKKRQAELLMEYFNILDNCKYSQTITIHSKMDEICSNLQFLNKRGTN